MIVKFLPTYTGGGLGSVNYLLNERTQQGTAKVLKGNEKQTRAIINQMTFKQKTCFGVLSFSEQANSISDEIKQEIIADFERTLLGDYMKERVNILWVEHSDKNGRLELNFLIPKIDLVTGKSFNPYFAKNDQFNIDLWKRTINDEYGFTSPDDPLRKSNIAIDKKDLEHYNTITELDNALKELVAQGAIKNRSHMIELLQDNGYTISRQNKTGISIILPNQKRPNRMKGGIYDANFTDFERLSELGESESRRIQQYANRDTQTECLLNRNRIERNIQKRDERNKQRYKQTTIGDKLKNERDKKIIDKDTENTREHIRHARRIRADNFQWSYNIHPSSYIFSWNASNGLYKIRTISNDNTRNRIVQRNRELAERARKIAERNRRLTEQAREHSKRQQDFKRELRKIATEQNDIILQRLIAEIQERYRESISNTQSRVTEINEYNQRNNEHQEQIEPNFNELRKRLSGFGTTIKDKFAELRATINNRLATTETEINEQIGERSRRLEISFKGAVEGIKRNIRERAKSFTAGLQSTFRKIRELTTELSSTRERIKTTKSEVNQLNEERRRKREQENSRSFGMRM